MPETPAAGDFEPIRPDEKGPGPDLSLIALKAGRVGFANYAYVVADGASSDAVVIDPGWEPSFLSDSLAAIGLRPAAVLLTHGHRDHTNAAPAISKVTDCPVHMSGADADHFGFDCERLIRLEGSQTLRFGSITVDALATPGHTAGSISYRIGGCLFTGDTLFSEGCGLSNPQNGGGDTAALFRSINHLRGTLSPNCRIYPGHRYREPIGQTLGALERGNIYLRFRDLGAFVRFCERPARMNQLPPAIGSVPTMKPELAILASPQSLRTAPPAPQHPPETEDLALRRAC
ncbi:MBL fold metallo-hydrolase [Fulvimarina sp. MAC8]|uniref:MBL fold metallo-hydrolase n=1 Tax=Fulvimarina sp. MAC8 TaxID=3162874 RepID=UPI0032ECFB28